ncbi:MAG TPA: hypothetical protein ENH95_02870 [Nitrosopumilus sp.]|nr:hypothetical protein [Nitrosopumilus sp.]
MRLEEKKRPNKAFLQKLMGNYAERPTEGKLLVIQHMIKHPNDWPGDAFRKIMTEEKEEK